jgi:thiol-disulfide isomerase/thioredoxin
MPGISASIVVVMSFASVLAWESGAFGGTEIGQPAPPLVVEELDGQHFDLGALRGKVVVITMWASWCPPCRAEMPALDAFYRRHHEQGIEMLGVSADDPHDRSEVLKAAQTVGYPAAMLSEAKPNGFGAPKALPMTYIIDGDGIVRAKLGAADTPLTEERLAALVLPLLPAGRTDRPQP